MFDIGFWELIFIALLTLLVAGPERLPGIVRGIGYWTGRTRSMINAVRSEFEREAERVEAAERRSKSAEDEGAGPDER